MSITGALTRATGATGEPTAVLDDLRPAPAPLSDGQAPGAQVLLRARGVRRCFGERFVLDGIDLEIRAGEFVSVLGRSGTGKSTLLRALDGFDREVTGFIEVPEHRSVVYQDARLLPWARVLDNVVLGLRGKHARAQARQALAEVGLTSHERAWPATLSGGEAQRIALARALIREPALLLLDEPFGALDALTRITMHGLLRTLCDLHHPAVLLVTHDVNEAIALSNRIVVLDRGRVVYDDQVLLDQPRQLHHPGFADGEEEDAVERFRREVFAATKFETRHPVVRVHPETHERSLLLGSFARSIVGVSVADSVLLLQLLQNHVTKIENTVRWHWAPGDVAIWDNRATQHYAPADYGDLPRKVRRITVAGPVPVSVDGRTSLVLEGADAPWYQDDRARSGV